MEQVNFKIFDSDQKTYFKRNFSEALFNIIPSVYSVKDYEVSGAELDPLDVLLETHLNGANAIDRLLFLSATPNFSELDSLSGIYPFFIKQSGLTNINPFTFERDLLDPLDIKLDTFETSASWKNYLQNDFLPAIKLNYPASSIPIPGGKVDTSSSYGLGGSALHEYYLNSLGWFYLLNTSAISPGTYDPSSYVLDKLSQLYFGKEFGVLDGIKGYQEYLWRNQETIPAISSLSLIPSNYLSGTNTYTSGTQSLDRLNTLLGILYSEGYADKQDYKVKDTFEDFLVLGRYKPEESPAGPFTRFIKVLGYVYQDLNSDVEKLESLYQIDSCPSEYLPYLSDLIGWELIGTDPNRWRSQLRNAIRIYKTKGTTFSTKLAVDSLFGDSGFSLSSSLYELYESYIPNLIYYILATGSPYFNNGGYKSKFFLNWTFEKAEQLGVTYKNEDGDEVVDYNVSSEDANIKKCVDKVLRDLWKLHPENFLLGNSTFPTFGTVEANNFKFFYRDRIYDIPPFEEIRYYEKTKVTSPLLVTLESSLLNFDVSSSHINELLNFIKIRSLSSTSDIEIGNNFVLFTSAFEEPFNFSDILTDISNTKSQYLSLWGGKSSHFDLHLSAASQSYSTKKSTTETSLGIYNSLLGLNRTIPAHAIPRVKVFLDTTDNISNFLYACPTLFQISKDLVTSSTAVNAWDGSGVDMNDFLAEFGLGHGLSSTSISRHYVDSISDPLVYGRGDTSKGAYVPRNSLRRRNLYTNLPRNGFFDRTGFNMPNSYAASTFDQFSEVSGGGALTLGYNYSGCEFQTPFINGYVSSLHPVWQSCETSTSTRSYFGVPSSGTFPWRGAASVNEILASGNCLQYVRREELPEIIRVMHKAMERDAYKEAYETFKSVSSDWQTSSYWRDPIQSLANSAYNGVTDWHDYADFTFGSGIHDAYNKYAKDFSRHGTAPHLVLGPTAYGGKNIFAHIYGPLLYNGNLNKDGSAISYIASSFTQENYQGLDNSQLISLGADSSAGPCDGNLVLGYNSSSCSDGEFRYPHGLSGIEFCKYYLSSTDSGPVFKIYRTSPKYGEDNPNIDSYLIDKGLIDIHCSGDSSFLNYARLRFDLSAFGSPTTSGNFLIPDHDFEFSMNLARFGLDPIEEVDIGVWIHTMPENGHFWSWVSRDKVSQFGKPWKYSNPHSNGEWISCSGENAVNPITDGFINGVFQYGVRDTLCNNVKVPKSSGVTSIKNLKSDHFNTYSIPFNTRNKQYRNSGDFLPKPAGYEPAFVHRTDQRYIVEIMVRSYGTKSIQDNVDYVFENISIIDKTLAETTLDKFTVQYIDDLGVTHTEEVTRTDIEDYRVYFKYMNNLAASSLGDGYGTRIAADSSGIFEASGGSRLNYRYHPKWGEHITASEGNYTLVNIVEGMSPEES